MADASCHCGAVKFTLQFAPHQITDCNCSICRRYGALWAYYAPEEVNFTTEDDRTETYMWDDHSIRLHRCKTCGCVTHWSPVDPARNRMGINARMLDPVVVADASLRHFDGADTESYIGE
ncbi:MAG: GFA family protein [Alphaproteobacteria bacterium]|nr:GFA family protein [Alphaproteobacteria bacterium]MBU2085072.1 GFA family protein [Alphaproteobacteria bacterium]MBU2141310.1 GFA family protein [Alphaproteobacteria bacterium]MBU2196637.1 GFA family protein [Alphaproteobacteria bacterium]